MRDESLGARIVQAVATETQTNPVQLNPPLHEFLDTEALDRALSSDHLSGHLEVTAWGRTVRIDAGTGEVTVADSESREVDYLIAD